MAKQPLIRSVEGVPKVSDFDSNLRYTPYDWPIVIDRLTGNMYIKNVSGEISQIGGNVHEKPGGGPPDNPGKK